METKIIKQIREKHPIIHCITNPVTVNDCANILLAIGASPTMAHHIQEVEEITTGCNALVCNLGATDDFDSMTLAIKQSNLCNHPVIIDPVGISGSTYRRNKLIELINTTHIDCIRGNYSEIHSLINSRYKHTGVDASKEDELHRDKLLSKMKEYASKHHLILIASGKIDLITDGNKSYVAFGGHEIMSRITGTGCMSSALLGAVLSVDNSVQAAQWLCTYMKETGEVAYEQTERLHGGTMTFREQLIDKVAKDCGY